MGETSIIVARAWRNLGCMLAHKQLPNALLLLPSQGGNSGFEYAVYQGSNVLFPLMVPSVLYCKSGCALSCIH